MIVIESVLVVCIGNLCRSPFASGFLRELLPTKTISSAGLQANPRMGNDSAAVSVASDMGIDLTGHSPVKLCDAQIQEHDLILVMERTHQAAVLQQAPTAAGKLFLMGHWNSKREITDPFRKSIDLYQLVFSQLRRDATLWAEKIG